MASFLTYLAAAWLFEHVCCEINRLRLPYRSMLAEQDFVVIYVHVSKLQLETADVRVQTMTECPQCKGKARVPIHGGLRDKDCPRCGGRGWIKG